MKEKLINLFDYNDYEKFNKLKWLPSKNFMCNPIFKSTLVYNVVKGPITQNKIFWEHNLDTNNLSIDNINHVIVRFDQLTRQTLHDNNKTGYLLKKEKQIILYNNQNILSLIDDKNELYLFDNVMNHEILLLIPFLYTLKYDMYNLFSIQTTGPIEYHDENLKELINSANNERNVKDKVLKYIENQNNEYATIIRDFYNDEKTYDQVQLRQIFTIIEDKIRSIIRNRNRLHKALNDCNLEITKINNQNKQYLKEIREYNLLLEEFKELANLPDTKTKKTKVEKFITLNQKYFAPYLHSQEKISAVTYFERKIDELYELISVYPKDAVDSREYILDLLHNDILGIYSLAINYMLLSMIIKLSDHIFNSIYEGNLIEKYLYGSTELKELIDIVNKDIIQK